MAATKGVSPARATSTTARATRADGGFETRRMASVPGSSRRAATASLAIRPSTASLRSRPPRPMTWVTVAPHRSSRLIASWAPVPAAATTPTRGPPPSTPSERTCVGEAQARPPEHGRPRPRAHDQQAEVGGPVLQLHLVGHRHVVAEEQDVEPGRQRLVRLQRGVVARHRHQGHVRPALEVDRLLQRAHRSLGGRAPGRRPGTRTAPPRPRPRPGRRCRRRSPARPRRGRRPTPRRGRPGRSPPPPGCRRWPAWPWPPPPSRPRPPG